jgi:hypothetical protein
VCRFGGGGWAHELLAQVLPRRSATEQLAAIRATRNRLTKASFDHDLIDRSKREGRA